MMRSAIRSPSTPSTSRARHACSSPQTISVSTTRCWMPPPVSPSRQPGMWPCEPVDGLLTHAGPLHSLSTSARARSSRRAGPVCPASAAAECVSSIVALSIERSGRYMPVAPERVQRVLQAVGERPVGGVVERARGRQRPRGAGGGEEHRGEQGATAEHEATAGTGAGAIGPAAGRQRDATGWGGRHGEHFLGRLGPPVRSVRGGLEPLGHRRVDPDDAALTGPCRTFSLL